MMRRLDERQVNQMLMSHGLGKLDDPGLIPQIGFLVSHVMRTHEQFRELVNRTEPSKRPAMYEALKPYVRAFEPKPLDVYIAELADLAERKQLPIQNEDGTLSEFKVPEISLDHDRDSSEIGSDLNKSADVAACSSDEELEAASAAVQAAAANVFLELTCRSCTYYEAFAGWNKDAAIAKARVSGWRAVHSEARNEDAELCPRCIETYWPSLK